MPKIFKSHPDFLESEQIKQLLNLFLHSNKIVEKATGPSTLDLPNFENELIFCEVLKKIKLLYPLLSLKGGNFFYSEKPYIVHVDQINPQPDQTSVTFLIPLEMTFSLPNYSTNECYLTIFNQTFQGGAAKFFFGDCDILQGVYPHHYTQDLVEGLETTSPVSTKEPLLSHLKPQWLQGLSIHKNIPWKVGSLIAFKGDHLHASSNFLIQNIKSKTALTLFAHYPKSANLFG